MDGMSQNGEFEARLKSAVAKPLAGWREVYEGFSPVDLETGERRPRVPEPDEDYRRAAVLVPILLAPEGARIIYTLRTGDLQDHAGQVSFPGGSLEPQDGSLLATALREAEEEVDLEPDLVEVIGELEEMYIPPSKFMVRPGARGGRGDLQRLTGGADEAGVVQEGDLGARGTSLRGTGLRGRGTRDLGRHRCHDGRAPRPSGLGGSGRYQNVELPA
jgi:8-oxo-dGTP pyrophosphatase MutT (NUDIX family)